MWNKFYLAVNRVGDELHFQPDNHLRDVIDQMKLMIEEGYIKADFSNDEESAPLSDLNLSLFHYYWFSPTEKGKQVWTAHP